MPIEIFTGKQSKFIHTHPYLGTYTHTHTHNCNITSGVHGNMVNNITVLRTYGYAYKRTFKQTKLLNTTTTQHMLSKAAHC